MANIMKIYKYGSDILRVKAEKVERVTNEIRQLVNAMIETMYQSRGVGLAAPQVGKSLRIIVIDPQDKKISGDFPLVLINPKIIETSGKIVEYEEGCLSIPKVYWNVKRPQKVKIEALDINGKKFIIEDDGVLGRIILHELDHLEGVLFVDHLNTLAKLSISRKLKEIAASND